MQISANNGGAKSSIDLLVERLRRLPVNRDHGQDAGGHSSHFAILVAMSKSRQMGMANDHSQVHSK